jgi:DNA-binding MarR family transcriptional regulator
MKLVESAVSDGEREAAAVLLASRALIGVAARSLSVVEDKITLPQYRALVLLGSRGDHNVGALANALAIHPSTATRLCDRLESKGFITRAPSPESRREITLKLAPAGARLLRAVTTRRRTEIHEILARLSRDERRRLRAAFEVFGAAAGELPDDAWKLGWTS